MPSTQPNRAKLQLLMELARETRSAALIHRANDFGRTAQTGVTAWQYLRSGDDGLVDASLDFSWADHWARPSPSPEPCVARQQQRGAA